MIHICSIIKIRCLNFASYVRALDKKCLHIKNVSVRACVVSWNHLPVFFNDIGGFVVETIYLGVEEKLHVISESYDWNILEV